LNANRLLRGTALVSCVAFLLVTVPFFVHHVAVKARESAEYAGADAAAARARFFGPRYGEALQGIEERVPREGEYLLFDESQGDGGDVFLRYDLSPRRAWLVGRRYGAKKEIAPKKRPFGFEFVVVSRDGGRAPRVEDAGLFFDGVPLDEVGREDASIPGWIDTPASGSEVKGPLAIAGWCQERGGRPCEAVRLFVDGEEVLREAVERFPRPDVEASVPGIGSCERAGFRVRPPFPLEEAGGHEVIAILKTADGRYRRIGPNTFRWSP